MQVIRMVFVTILFITVIIYFIASYLIYKITKKRSARTSIHEVDKESDICQTTFPILLLHGMGLRDSYYLNYWGYIPKELKKNGATIYYGKQDALGSIEHNSMEIRKKILEIIKTEKCKKINIIAHSKGGLEARYVIAQLGMAKYIASLTTISTPHRGSYFADYVIKKIPYPIFYLICHIFNKIFLKIGDTHPDYYTCVKQLTTTYAYFFNTHNQNNKNVYYQSYATVMKHCFSCPFLAIPYTIIAKKDKHNDGLVTVSSAKWGHFQNVFYNTSLGTSHTDIIALTSKDSSIVTMYFEIIIQLKKLGY